MARLLTPPIFRLCQHRSAALPLLAVLFASLLLSACAMAPQSPAPAEQAALGIDLLPPEAGASYLQVRVTGAASSSGGSYYGGGGGVTSGGSEKPQAKLVVEAITLAGSRWVCTSSALGYSAISSGSVQQ